MFVRREEIMDVIKRVYHFQKKQNCPVYHATTSNLKDYTTTEKDMKKGSSRFPPPNLRNKSEDIFTNAQEEERANSLPESFETEDDLAAKQKQFKNVIEGTARGSQ